MLFHDLCSGSFGPLELELDPNDTWCFIGENASGKSVLAALLGGRVEPTSGALLGAPTSRELISFEESQARYERELSLDDTNFTDEIDDGSTGLELLRESGATDETITALAAQFGVVKLLERGCRLFSSGEWRRIELLRVALARPALLVLDEAFESLDVVACGEMRRLLEQLRSQGTVLVFFVGRLADVPDIATHVAVLHHGKLIASGPKRALLESEALSSLFTFDWTKDVSVLDAPARQFEGPLVEARGLTVRYGDCVQFAPFDWKLEAGEHTRIVGPNGSGKSTLLGLITGDHPQCYANDLNVVGYKRGSGESIWDLKKHIGYFSPALHRDYRVSATALTVVVSGFFDSIGLYQQPTKDQIALAKRFLDLFDLVEAADTSLHALSFGHQRLVLAARSLVKRPPLLILDEPTQGLDALNAALVLRYVERLAQQGRTTLLFVSHRVDEVIAGVDRILRFVPSTRANTRYEVVASSVVGGETDAAYVKKPEFAQNVLGV